MHPRKDFNRCVLPPSMLVEDQQRMPEKYRVLFQRTLQEMFQCDNLEKLHECDHGPVDTMAPALYHARIQAKVEKGARGVGESRDIGKRIIKSQKAAWRNNEHLKRFVEIYKSFVFEHIMPQFKDFGEIIYQAEPLIRIVFPGSVAPAKLHADGDFWHQANELNYWVPVVDVDGASSLWSESFPNAGAVNAIWHAIDFSCWR